jgi:imidazole glycerol-phosphate synthase subunit HisH
MNTIIIKYNAGNIRSVKNALERMGYSAEITDDKAKIKSADKVIFPGVGEAGTTMKNLRDSGLDKLIKELRQPVLGICLGMQLMCNHSEEGNTDCMGIFDLEVKKFPPKNKVPHMGWNSLQRMNGKLFRGLNDDIYVYFVHSYYVESGINTSAFCDYILPFSASLEKNNFFATQFHPEKSGDIGHGILKNFMSL